MTDILKNEEAQPIQFLEGTPKIAQRALTLIDEQGQKLEEVMGQLREVWAALNAARGEFEIDTPLGVQAVKCFTGIQTALKMARATLNEALDCMAYNFNMLANTAPDFTEDGQRNPNGAPSDD